jgi:hypothetical protein
MIRVYGKSSTTVAGLLTQLDCSRRRRPVLGTSILADTVAGN